MCFIALISGIFASCGSPDARFSVGYANGEENPTQLKFTNASQGSDSYMWYFGDDGTSTEENPVHNFKIFGDVMVVLEARKGSSATRDTQYVNIPEPPRKKVKIETPFGVMIAELYNTTPRHRDNFLKLASEGFFDGLLFHRIMDNFMVQGGDPESRTAEPGQQLGMGGPGYTLDAEIRERHYKGALASARKPDGPNSKRESNGSQFYIAEGKRYSSIELAQVGEQYKTTFNEFQKKKYAEQGGTPFLDNLYTVFGQVIEGLEVLDELSTVKVNSMNRPLEDVPMKISVIND